MSFPDIPAGMGIPLVTLADGLLPEDTMDALDARYDTAGGEVPTGGTTGQVLTKDSGTDFDTSWQTPVEYVTGDGILNIEAITRTAYDLLSPPVATTLYVIDEAS